MKTYTYGNKNKIITDLTDLNSLLALLASTEKKLTFYAMGGTAMCLYGIKPATKDIDFMTDNTYEEINEAFTKAGLKEISKGTLVNIWYLNDIRVDIFYDGYIIGIPLNDDWKEKSTFVKKQINLTLSILNWEDIIITKLARHSEADIVDSIAIFKTQKLDFEKLKERYYSYKDIILSESTFDYKWKIFEKRLRRENAL